MESDKFNSFGAPKGTKPRRKRASTASLQANKTTTPGQVKKTRTTLASLPGIKLTPLQLPLHQIAQQIDGCDYTIPSVPGTDIDLYKIFLENYGFINQYSDPIPTNTQILTQLRTNGLWRNLNNYPMFDYLFTLKQLKWYCCYSIQFYLDYRHDFNGVMTTVEKTQLCTQMHTDLYCVLQRFKPLQLLPLYTLSNIYTNPTILGFYDQNNPYFIFLNEIFENVRIDFDANRATFPQLLLDQDYNNNGAWPTCTYTSKEYIGYNNDTPTNLESRVFNFILNPTNNILSTGAVRQQVPITIYPRKDFVTIYSENNISDQFNNPDVINLYSEYLSAIMGIQKIDFKRLKRTIFGTDNSKHNDQLIKTLIHINSNNNINNINDIDIINGTNRSYFIGVDALSSNEKINPLTTILNSTITYQQPPIQTGRNTYNFPNNSVETNNYNLLSPADQATINTLLTSNPPDPVIIGNFNPNIRLRDNLVIAQRSGRGASSISTANPNVLTNLYTVPFQNINNPNNWNHYFTSDIDILDGAAANNNIRKTLSPFMINNPAQDDQTRSLPNNSQIDYVRTDIHYNIFFNVRTGNGTFLLIPNIIDLTLNGRPNIYDVRPGPKQTTLTINCFLKYHNLPNFNSDNFGLIPKTLSIANINTFIGFNQNTIQNISYRIYKTALDYIKILNFWSAINGKFNFSNPLQYDLNIDNTEKYGFLYDQNVLINPTPFIITNNNRYNNFFILNDIVAADKSSIMIPSTIVIEGSENFGEFHDNSLKFFLRSYKLKQFWNNFIPTMVNPRITRPPFNTNPLYPILHINQGGFGKKRWIQQAIKKQKQKGTTGSFKRWCKSKGFGDKVTLKCINEAKQSKNKTIRQKANFAKNIKGYTTNKNIIKQINNDIKYLSK
jgi:hypothetical protein